jgi:hypothetical protein
MGGIVDPNTAWMLMRSLETVELRMQRAGENAAKVCAFLAQHPKVEGLGYLGMISDSRQQDIYERHCLGAGSTFSVFIKGGEAESFAFLDNLRIAKLAVSLEGDRAQRGGGARLPLFMPAPCPPYLAHTLPISCGWSPARCAEILGFKGYWRRLPSAIPSDFF